MSRSNKDRLEALSAELSALEPVRIEPFGELAKIVLGSDFPVMILPRIALREAAPKPS